jgi:hypothetical protein
VQVSQGLAVREIRSGVLLPASPGWERQDGRGHSVRQGSVGYPAESPCAWMSSTAASRSCPTEEVGQRSRRNLERIYQVPPVPPPAAAGTGGAERGPNWPKTLWKAAGRSMHWGGEARQLLLARGHRPNRNRKRRQGSTAGNVFGFVQPGKAPEVRVGSACSGEGEGLLAS